MQLGKQLSNGASRAAGAEFIRLLAGFGSGEAEFPPHPPSASPSLGLAEIFAAGLQFFSLPHPPCTEKIKELPLFCLPSLL